MHDITLPYDNLLATSGDNAQNYIRGDVLLAAEGLEGSLRYLQDHLGSPVRLAQGEVTQLLAFDEFRLPLDGRKEAQVEIYWNKTSSASPATNTTKWPGWITLRPATTMPKPAHGAQTPLVFLRSGVLLGGPGP